MSDRTVTEHVRHTSGALAHEPALGLMMVSRQNGLTLTPLGLDRPLSVGRGETADIVLDDAGASRSHARFERRGDVVFLQDLGSRNGTWANGSQVGPPGVLLVPHSIVRVGRTLFVVTDVGGYARPRPPELPGLYGGASLDDARDCIVTIAPSRSAVLVLGETGTGKEVVARLVHEQSGRAGPFVALNCAAVPSELVDAELFGHAKGAFSGALRERTGLFRSAHGGTLFLDEIGEMPAAVQAKLLRTLETGEVRPVGDDSAVFVDTRVVAATNREVDDLVESGAFRGDLLHRLAGLRVRLPPLRERREDIPLLVTFFLGESGADVSPGALERLLLHPWPGNVRELRNVIAAAVEVARRKGRGEIAEEDLIQLLVVPASKSAAPSAEDQAVQRIIAALTECGGDVATAATRLNMGRSALYEALRRFNIDPRPYRRR